MRVPCPRGCALLIEPPRRDVQEPAFGPAICSSHLGDAQVPISSGFARGMNCSMAGATGWGARLRCGMLPVRSAGADCAPALARMSLSDGARS